MNFLNNKDLIIRGHYTYLLCHENANTESNRYGVPRFDLLGGEPELS